jgi:hypothetical protein
VELVVEPAKWEFCVCVCLVFTFSYTVTNPEVLTDVHV